jgi:hypothetical protein
MYSPWVLCLEIICAAIILFRAIQIGSRLDWKRWSGHPLQFIGNSVAYPLLAGGALGILLDRNGGFLLLLVGIMFQMLSERRTIR